MTKKQADKKLNTLFEQLCDEALNTENSTELCALTDSAHKLYITLCNAGAFEEGIDAQEPGGLLN